MDVISLSAAAKANKRIENTNNNPDSTSGIVTVPKVIEASESVTIPAGRMAILPDVQVDGTLTVDGDVFVPSGATTSVIDAELALKADQTALDAKQFVATTTSNVMVDGSLAISNTLVTKAFVAKGWTGTGASNPIDISVGGIDFTVANNGSGYWHDRTTGDGTIKDDAGNIVTSGSIVLPNNKFILDVHIKKRSGGTIDDDNSANVRYDGLRGGSNAVLTDQTDVEVALSSISYNDTGFTIGDGNQNTNANDDSETYISYTRVYTHIEWGLTSQGKSYICAYNPITRQTLTLYQGSGNAGHQIPNPLGVKLNYWVKKRISNTRDWIVGTTILEGYYGSLNLTDNFVNDGATNRSGVSHDTYFEDNNDVNNEVELIYGFANSETQIITQYGGTGASGNFVPTNDVYGVGRKPRMVVVKRTDDTGNWAFTDSEMGDLTQYQVSPVLCLNSSNIENSIINRNIQNSSTGLIINYSNLIGRDDLNASGGQYIAIVYFDSQLSTTINTLEVL